MSFAFPGLQSIHSRMRSRVFHLYDVMRPGTQNCNEILSISLLCRLKDLIRVTVKLLFMWPVDWKTVHSCQDSALNFGLAVLCQIWCRHQTFVYRDDMDLATKRMWGYSWETRPKCTLARRQAPLAKIFWLSDLKQRFIVFHKSAVT